MKQKDIVYLIITLAIVAIVGLLVYSKYANKGGSKGVTQVEVVDPISNSFSSETLSDLNDSTKAVDFTPSIDLSGLGNSQPFGPLH